MNRYAILNDATQYVKNVIVAQDSNFFVETGHTAVLLSPSQSCEPGSFFEGGSFRPAPPTRYHTWNGSQWIIEPATLSALKDTMSDFEQKFDALLKAFALVLLDEINAIRTNPALGLQARTVAQLKTAIKNKLPDPT